MAKQPQQIEPSASRPPATAARTSKTPRGPAGPARPGAGGVPDQRALVLASLLLHPYPREQHDAPRS